MSKFQFVYWRTGLGNQKHGNIQSGIVGKWLWHYAVEADALWGGVEDKRYGSTWGGWYSDGVNGPFGVNLLKRIRNGWGKLSGSLNLRRQWQLHLIFARFMVWGLF